MTLTDYRTLGRSGLHVSPLCLGGMTFGAPNNSAADEPTSEAMMDAFAEAGGNFIDTSNVYCRGESERIIGRWLGASPYRRDRMVLATKFSASATRGDPNSGGASRKAILAACEASLRRLGTDYIDLYWMHWQDPITPVEETMRALETLVAAGKVRYLGFSDTPSWAVAHAQGIATAGGLAPLIALQIEYSLLERSVEFDYVPMAAALGLGIAPFSPLSGGALTGKYRRDGSVVDGTVRAAAVHRRLREREHAIVDVLVEIAGHHGGTPGQIALAWLLGREGVTSPIIGARTLDQYRQSIAALDIDLAPEDRERLDVASKPRAHFPHNVLSRIWGTSHADLTIDGRHFQPSPAAPTGEHSLG
ncbi:MAG: aldo/keto reductase [Sphingomonadales bacterium]|nr:MAG: aldo/keto reductase [Sphingomonadales bacterium]